ncbi:Uncharacterised protein [Bordetella pertussis]|nr:Uncharacterised protein [Bordetella pertussis]
MARLARGFGLARCLFFRGVETGSMPIPSVALGQQVAAGQQVGTLCEPARPDRPPLTLASPQDGTVVCLRALARSDDGDCLLQIAPARPFETLSTLY